MKQPSLTLNAEPLTVYKTDRKELYSSVEDLGGGKHKVECFPSKCWYVRDSTDAPVEKIVPVFEPYGVMKGTTPTGYWCIKNTVRTACLMRGDVTYSVGSSKVVMVPRVEDTPTLEQIDPETVRYTFPGCRITYKATNGGAKEIVRLPSVPAFEGDTWSFLFDYKETGLDVSLRNGSVVFERQGEMLFAFARPVCYDDYAVPIASWYTLDVKAKTIGITLAGDELRKARGKVYLDPTVTTGYDDLQNLTATVTAGISVALFRFMLPNLNVASIDTATFSALETVKDGNTDSNMVCRLHSTAAWDPATATTSEVDAIVAALGSRATLGTALSNNPTGWKTFDVKGTTSTTGLAKVYADSSSPGYCTVMVSDPGTTDFSTPTIGSLSSYQEICWMDASTKDQAGARFRAQDQVTNIPYLSFTYTASGAVRTSTGALSTAKPTVASTSKRGAKVNVALTKPTPTVAGTLKRSYKTTSALTNTLPVVASTSKRGSKGSGALSTGKPTVNATAPLRRVASSSLTYGLTTIAGTSKRGSKGSGALASINPTVAGTSKRGAKASSSLAVTLQTFAGTSKRGAKVNVALTKPTPTVAGAAGKAILARGSEQTSYLQMTVVHGTVNCSRKECHGSLVVPHNVLHGTEYKTCRGIGSLGIGKVVIGAGVFGVRNASGVLVMRGLIPDSDITINTVAVFGALQVPPVTGAAIVPRVIHARGSAMLLTLLSTSVAKKIFSGSNPSGLRMLPTLTAITSITSRRFSELPNTVPAVTLLGSTQVTRKAKSPVESTTFPTQHVSGQAVWTFNPTKQATGALAFPTSRAESLTLTKVSYATSEMHRNIAAMTLVASGSVQRYHDLYVVANSLGFRIAGVGLVSAKPVVATHSIFIALTLASTQQVTGTRRTVKGAGTLVTRVLTPALNVVDTKQQAVQAVNHTMPRVTVFGHTVVSRAGAGNAVSEALNLAVSTEVTRIARANDTLPSMQFAGTGYGVKKATGMLQISVLSGFNAPARTHLASDAVMMPAGEAHGSVAVSRRVNGVLTLPRSGIALTLRTPSVFLDHQHYRVIGITRVPGDPVVLVQLEAMRRPIHD